uniref:Uncharacterized protein n=2 Tax=Culex quinquefasciatus TaxID=7176 RepID=A0A1S4KGV8_CULQU
GRVGPRQPAKPQFQFQTGPGGYNQQQQHPHHQQPPHHHRGGAGPNNENHFNRNASGRKSDKDVNGGKQQRGGPQQQQGPAGSVQDRLNRNRVGASNGGGSSSSEQIKSNPSLKTISKIIEKNAEIDERLARQMFQENEKMASRMKELRMQDGA